MRIYTLSFAISIAVLLYLGYLFLENGPLPHLVGHSTGPASAAAYVATSSGKLTAKASTTAVAPPTTSVTTGPIISLDFDDGFESAYQNALPIIHAAGYKTTQYIITHAINTKNYVTTQQVLAMQAEGDEIGAHTQTHPHLTQIPLAQAQQEIDGSKQDLENLGITSVTTFAYPYGSHNAALENLVKQDGFINARITWPGFNDAKTDPYALYYFGITASTTPAMVDKAIDTAAANKKWLIIVFHRVEPNPTQGANSEDTSPQFVQALVDYIHAKKIPVVTNAQGFQIMKNIL